MEECQPSRNRKYFLAGMKVSQNVQKKLIKEVNQVSQPECIKESQPSCNGKYILADLEVNQSYRRQSTRKYFLADIKDNQNVWKKVNQGVNQISQPKVFPGWY